MQANTLARVDENLFFSDMNDERFVSQVTTNQYLRDETTNDYAILGVTVNKNGDSTDASWVAMNGNNIIQIAKGVGLDGLLNTFEKQTPGFILDNRSTLFADPDGLSTYAYDYQGNVREKRLSVAEDNPLLPNVLSDRILQTVQVYAAGQLVGSRERSFFKGDLFNWDAPASESASWGTGNFNSEQLEFIKTADGSDSMMPVARHSVQSGDTLKALAQRYYGSGDLWYIIAEYNGLTQQGVLNPGTQLTIPSVSNNGFRTADNFALYNADSIIESPLPDVNPAQASGDDCIGAGWIVLIVVVALLAVIATIATAGALGPVFAAATAAGTTTGAAVLVTASAVALSVLAGAAIGAASGALIQAILIGAGVQDEFDSSELGLSILSGALGGLVGGLGQAYAAFNAARTAVEVGVKVSSSAVQIARAVGPVLADAAAEVAVVAIEQQARYGALNEENSYEFGVAAGASLLLPGVGAAAGRIGSKLTKSLNWARLGANVRNAITDNAADSARFASRRADAADFVSASQRKAANAAKVQNIESRKRVVQDLIDLQDNKGVGTDAIVLIDRNTSGGRFDEGLDQIGLKGGPETEINFIKDTRGLANMSDTARADLDLRIKAKYFGKDSDINVYGADRRLADNNDWAKVRENLANNMKNAFIGASVKERLSALRTEIAMLDNEIDVLRSAALDRLSSSVQATSGRFLTNLAANRAATTSAARAATRAFDADVADAIAENAADVAARAWRMGAPDRLSSAAKRSMKKFAPPTEAQIKAAKIQGLADVKKATIERANAKGNWMERIETLVGNEQIRKELKDATKESGAFFDENIAFAEYSANYVRARQSGNQDGIDKALEGIKTRVDVEEFSGKGMFDLPGQAQVNPKMNELAALKKAFNAGRDGYEDLDLILPTLTGRLVASSLNDNRKNLPKYLVESGVSMVQKKPIKTGDELLGLGTS